MSSPGYQQRSPWITNPLPYLNLQLRVLNDPSQPSYQLRRNISVRHCTSVTLPISRTAHQSLRPPAAAAPSVALPISRLAHQSPRLSVALLISRLALPTHQSVSCSLWPLPIHSLCPSVAPLISATRPSVTSPIGCLAQIKSALGPAQRGSPPNSNALGRNWERSFFSNSLTKHNTQEPVFPENFSH